jgi:alpha-beta hydrolase superfamily lysophospholipase
MPSISLAPDAARGMSRHVTALLVHGMARRPGSMFVLALRLRHAGIQPWFFSYSTAREDFSQIAKRLALCLEDLSPKPCIAIGHSLGGLLLREAIARLGDASAKPQHLFLLAAPAYSPRLARRLRSNPVYRAIAGDAGQLLADKTASRRWPRRASPPPASSARRDGAGIGARFKMKKTTASSQRPRLRSQTRVSCDCPVFTRS